MRLHSAAFVCLLLACTRKPIDTMGETGSSGPATAGTETGLTDLTSADPGASGPTTVGSAAETSTTQIDPTLETEPPTGYAMSGETECVHGYSGGDTCFHSLQCIDGFYQTIVCDSNGCNCSQDGELFQQCPYNGLCDLDDDAALNEAVNKCCGFMWMF